jgi:hypothetical protein
MSMAGRAMWGEPRPDRTRSVECRGQPPALSGDVRGTEEVPVPDVSTAGCIGAL